MRFFRKSDETNKIIEGADTNSATEVSGMGAAINTVVQVASNAVGTATRVASSVTDTVAQATAAVTNPATEKLDKLIAYEKINDTPTSPTTASQSRVIRSSALIATQYQAYSATSPSGVLANTSENGWLRVVEPGEVGLYQGLGL